ncbi:hypothetical protein COCC4DRAFT_200611 [Bipolaris maydis ATCC 48331]|uniref:Uncharacterized protein n=2 Tax=Cochliobolus heterostrophus TaxID=5016 RepID=M2UFK1_COCH5|nr:uncharacterized protein COCC4DRAFT_200611 [Bipolaris maydis ATCC 48331]EMD86768.1 hypothetical protein COCHEDRAFT_1146525 [Bipolaris maydis C5]ENI03161.1 hypothetical protein COCC4DRAFT_200611 [Bipolaris maydis ATCC 48331]
MNGVPVNFEYVRHSRLDGRAYFQDPKYPQLIQFVENGKWVSIHVLCIKPYIMDENMKKIVEDAKRSLPEKQNSTETPSPSQRPTLLPLESYHANIVPKAPHHNTVEGYREPQRQLLPALKSGASVSTWRYSYSEAHGAETQRGQAAPGSHHRRPDYYSMPSHIERPQAAPIVNKGDFSHQSTVLLSRCSHRTSNTSI